MITGLCNLVPLETHVYIVKLGFIILGFTGVFFLIFAQNIDSQYKLEPPHLGGSKVYQQSMF